MGDYGPWLVVAAVAALVWMLCVNWAQTKAKEYPVATSALVNRNALIVPFALLILAYPAITVLAPSVAEAVLVLPLPLFAVLILTRLTNVLWPAIWLAALTGVYAFSTWLGPPGMYLSFPSEEGAGLVHTVTVASVGAAFLMFALYGDGLRSYAGMKAIITGVVAADIIAVFTHVDAKNAVGGTVVYLTAVLCVAWFGGGKLGALLLSAVAAAVGVAIGFRAMIAYTAVFLIAYMLSARVSGRAYFWGGIAATSAAISGMLWFHRNLTTSPLARDIAYRIEELSGRRANSGRETLWPRILQTTEENPLFGMGAGVVPRDFLSTQLSSHNYYIQLYLQVGLIGLAVLLLFLLAVWRKLAYSTNAEGRFGAALFLMFVIHNSTEVIMFQNLTLAAVPAWCAIGLALAHTHPPGGDETASGDAARADKSVVPHSRLA